MTLYVREKQVKVRYYPILRPWYRVLDWWQGNDIACRFWTSRTGRVLCWLVPKLIVGLFRLAVIFIMLVFTVGFGLLFITLNMALGGGALGKASRSNR
jgi:hypothetical protein